MVLEQLSDGASRLLDRVPAEDEGYRRLVFILCLPLVDGVFATLLVTGAVETFSDIVAVGLTIFSGAGALAVLYSHADTREEARRLVLKAAPVLLAGAMVVALVAPVYRQMFYVHRLRYAAGLALVVISAHLLEIDLAEKFSTPAIILTGLLLSIRSPGALSFSFTYVFPALATALTASAALYAGSYLTHRDMHLAHVKRGGALVLLTIAVSQFGYELPSELGLAVFAASVAASLRA